MKRILLVLLFCCLFPVISYAWGPEGFYDGVEDMPPSLQTLVKEGGSVLRAWYTGDSSLVVFDEDEGKRRLAIYEKKEGIYQYVAGSSVMTDVSFDGYWPHAVYVTDKRGYCYNFALDYTGNCVLNGIQKPKCDVQFCLNGLIFYDYAEDGYISQEYYCYGNYSPIALSTLTFEQLPTTIEQCLAMLDTTNWATVSNPVSTDRLHLRVSPDKDSASLGKYYNGTPVYIEKDLGTWAKVRVGGVSGYMMKRYLRMTAYEKNNVNERKFLDYFLTEEATEMGVNVYSKPDTNADVIGMIGNRSVDTIHDQYYIAGIVDDDWYHILWADQGGYVQTKYFWPGNG